MNNILILLTLALLSTKAVAQTPKIDLKQLAKAYYTAWVATQSPNASKQDLQAYLALLTDDVGHQHLPYDPDDSRVEDNKNRMLEGMTYYLATHTDYSATLDSMTIGDNVIVLQYTTNSKGIHPQTNEIISQSYQTTEVLEIEAGKVSVIRKYSE